MKVIQNQKYLKVDDLDAIEEARGGTTEVTILLAHWNLVVILLAVAQLGILKWLQWRIT